MPIANQHHTYSVTLYIRGLFPAFLERYLLQIQWIFFACAEFGELWQENVRARTSWTFPSIKTGQNQFFSAGQNVQMESADRLSL